MSRQRLLVVEDDTEMRNVIVLALRAYGYDVSQVSNGADALAEIRTRTPDGVILDIGLPDIDGFVVTACIRRDYELPIIVLSARGEEQHQVRALDSGANDYVVKPFREGELMARVRAALRRPVPLIERRELTIGDIRLDSLNRQVYLNDVEVRLTKTEYGLLHVLARNVDRVVTHGQLLRAVWGPERVNEVQCKFLGLSALAVAIVAIHAVGSLLTISTAYAQEAAAPGAAVLTTDLIDMAKNPVINPINTMWVLLGAFLVFGMQAGFTMLEAGMCRNRETVNVLVECVFDTCVCGLLHWAFGFAFMFGGGNAFIGWHMPGDPSKSLIFMKDVGVLSVYGATGIPIVLTTSFSSPLQTVLPRSVRVRWSAALASSATSATRSACPA